MPVSAVSRAGMDYVSSKSNDRCDWQERQAYTHSNFSSEVLSVMIVNCVASEPLPAIVGIATIGKAGSSLRLGGEPGVPDVDGLQDIAVTEERGKAFGVDRRVAMFHLVGGETGSARPGRAITTLARCATAPCRGHNRTQPVRPASICSRRMSACPACWASSRRT